MSNKAHLSFWIEKSIRSKHYSLQQLCSTVWFVKYINSFAICSRCKIPKYQNKSGNIINKAIFEIVSTRQTYLGFKFFSYSCCHDKCYVVKYFVEWIKIFSSSSSYLESIVLDWTLPWINLHRKAAVSHWNIQNSKPLRYNQLLVGSHLLADSLPLFLKIQIFLLIQNIFVISRWFQIYDISGGWLWFPLGFLGCKIVRRFQNQLSGCTWTTWGPTIGWMEWSGPAPSCLAPSSYSSTVPSPHLCKLSPT